MRGSIPNKLTRTEAPKPAGTTAAAKPEDAEVMRLRGGDGHRARVDRISGLTRRRPDRLVPLLPVYLLFVDAFEGPEN